ncbi:MAG: bifunctional nuclease family protein [Calditrichaeota bacterium]|nr:bifunctional nuclease family protein [Calditrichota bacterium]
MLVSVRVDRVTLDTATSRFVVVLRDDAHNRWLPIVVGSTEAQAIALQLEKVEPPRPLTHDLMKNLLESLDAKVSRVVVTELRENTYYAKIGLQLDGKKREIDARPSDAIALALRMNAPIFVVEEVMKKAAVVDRQEAREREVPLEERLEQLAAELEGAIQEERYEDAARLRDEIRKLKEQQAASK